MGGWYGVDLDGTLAYYNGWQGMLHIGEPIPIMLERVKAWVARGIEVRIVTARADPDHEEYDDFCRALQAWCESNVGKILPITNRKDFGMILLFDDRAVGVIANTGVLTCGHDADF